MHVNENPQACVGPTAVWKCQTTDKTTWSNARGPRTYQCSSRSNGRPWVGEESPGQTNTVLRKRVVFFTSRSTISFPTKKETGYFFLIIIGERQATLYTLGCPGTASRVVPSQIRGTRQLPPPNLNDDARAGLQPRRGMRMCGWPIVVVLLCSEVVVLGHKTHRSHSFLIAGTYTAFLSFTSGNLHSPVRPCIVYGIQ